MSNENKELFRRFVSEVINGQNLAALDQITAEDAIEHEVLDPELPGGREGVKIVMGIFHDAFPDLNVAIEDLISEGDKVVARTLWKGTHQGELFGIPPTGKSVEFASIDIVRVANSMISEHWAVTDTYALMQQLGAIPDSGP